MKAFKIFIFSIVFYAIGVVVTSLPTTAKTTDLGFFVSCVILCILLEERGVI